MFDNMATDVLEKFKLDEMNESMDGRWEDKASDYPDVLNSVLILSLNAFTLKWIEENMPLAWFKPMFMSKADRDSLLST